jgi:ribosomal protein L37AE/L43A
MGVGRIVDGVATTERDLIEGKECPKCAESIRRRARFCQHCKYSYPEDQYAAEQEAFAALEAQMKRQ